MEQSVLLFICLIFSSLWVIQAFECDISLPAQAGVLVGAVPSPPPVLCLSSSWKDKMCNLKKKKKLKISCSDVLSCNNGNAKIGFCQLCFPLDICIP